MTPVAARHRLRLRIVAFTLALLAVGCHSEWRPRLEEPASIKPSDEVMIWTSGSSELWHAVAITSDSVSGIPYETSLECDSCRRSMPLVLVDSMKVRHKTSAKHVAGMSALMVGVAVAATLVEAIVCHALGLSRDEC
jgi:hypothetical protein